jgi:hypothetical protein
VIFLVASLAAVLAHEPQLPAGVSCEQIRTLVAEHGLAKAIYWARSHGYSWSDINEARKCLR